MVFPWCPRFPLHDPERLQQWLRNMGRVGWTPSPHQYVCHQHFTESCFRVSLGTRSLEDAAVPTVFRSSEVGPRRRGRCWRAFVGHACSSLRRLDASFSFSLFSLSLSLALSLSLSLSPSPPSRNEKMWRSPVSRRPSIGEVTEIRGFLYQG